MPRGTPSNDIPRSFKFLQVLWPIGLTLLISGATVVQTSAKVGELDSQMADLRTNGAPVIRERLARIEASQNAQGAQLTRMERLLEDLDKRTREKNLNGL